MTWALATLNGQFYGYNAKLKELYFYWDHLVNCYLHTTKVLVEHHLKDLYIQQLLFELSHEFKQICKERRC